MGPCSLNFPDFYMVFVSYFPPGPMCSSVWPLLLVHVIWWSFSLSSVENQTKQLWQKNLLEILSGVFFLLRNLLKLILQYFFGRFLKFLKILKWNDPTSSSVPLVVYLGVPSSFFYIRFENALLDYYSNCASNKIF